MLLSLGDHSAFSYFFIFIFIFIFICNFIFQQTIINLKFLWDLNLIYGPKNKKINGILVLTKWVTIQGG